MKDKAKKESRMIKTDFKKSEESLRGMKAKLIQQNKDIKRK